MDNEVVLFAVVWTLVFILSVLLVVIVWTGKRKFKELKFVRHIRDSVHLYRMGYFLSDSTHKSPDLPGQWGFIRLNFERGGVKDYAIFDIDFCDTVFSHVHRVSGGVDLNLHRWDAELPHIQNEVFPDWLTSLIDKNH